MKVIKNELSVSLEQISRLWEKHEELTQLDKMLEEFLEDPRSAKNSLWMSSLRKGLGLTHSGLAEKMKMARQAVQQMEEREAEAKITVASLKRFADAIECDFVYGFIPRNHNSFAEILTEKTIPFVLKPEPQIPISQTRYSMALAGRIKKFLSLPIGKGKAWGLKKAMQQRKEYSWIWRD